MSENPNVDVVIERLSQNINNLVGSLESLKFTTEKLSEQMRAHEINYGKLNIENRLNKLENWQEEVGEVWNIDGMKETKKKATDSEKLSIKVATIYGSIIFLIVVLTFIINLLKLS